MTRASAFILIGILSHISYQDKNRLGDVGIAAVVAAVTNHAHVELLWLSKNGASEAGALAVAPGLAQMRSLKKFTCDFKDAVEAHVPHVTAADKDDWNRRLKSLMGIDEVNEQKKKRAEAAKVRFKTGPGPSKKFIAAQLCSVVYATNHSCSSEFVASSKIIFAG